MDSACSISTPVHYELRYGCGLHNRLDLLPFSAVSVWDSEDRRLGFLVSTRVHVAMDGGGAGASEDKSEGWGEMMDAAWRRVLEKGKTLRSWNSIPGGKSMRWPSWRAPEGSQTEGEEEQKKDNEEEISELMGFLKALQLEEYAEVLLENGLYIEQLRTTTERDLKKLGIPLGPRRKICSTIAKDPQWSGFQVN